MTQLQGTQPLPNFKSYYKVRVAKRVSLQFSSVAQLCLTLCDPMDCSMPGFPVHHQLQSLLKLMSIKLVMPSNHLILCHPLLLPTSIFPSIRVFSNKSVLCIRWPNYWSFSISICPSNEYSGLIFFRMEWLDLLAVQEIQESSSTPQFKSINSSAFSFLYSPTLTRDRNIGQWSRIVSLEIHPYFYGQLTFNKNAKEIQ